MAKVFQWLVTKLKAERAPEKKCTLQIMITPWLFHFKSIVAVFGGKKIKTANDFTVYDSSVPTCHIPSSLKSKSLSERLSVNSVLYLMSLITLNWPLASSVSTGCVWCRFGCRLCSGHRGWSSSALLPAVAPSVSIITLAISYPNPKL